MALKIGFFATFIIAVIIATPWANGRSKTQSDKILLNQQESQKFFDKRDYSREEDWEEDRVYEQSAEAAPSTEAPTSKLCQHPCAGTEQNRTITTPEGETITCLVPTTDELIEQLEKIGGYNRHYVAITMEEARENFVDLFPQHRYDTAKPRLGQLQSHDDFLTSPPAGNCTKAGTTVNSRRQLCQTCKSLKELPTYVFPRYTYEETCDMTVTGASPGLRCYGIDGDCLQKIMTIDVLTKKAEDYKLIRNGTTANYKQVWSPNTLGLKSCCQCWGN